MDEKLHEAIKLHKMFKAYRKQMRDIWESFNLIEYYMPIIHNKIKEDKIETLKFRQLYSNQIYQLSKVDTFGAISSITRRGNHERTLLCAVSTFEDYISNMAYSIYKFCPQKLISSDIADDEKQRMKLLSLIVNSENRSEMIDCLIEEKIRSIFYGNPVDVFLKDKCKLEFGDHFKNNLGREISYYTEIVATRNITVHNARRIDGKYLREVKVSKFKIGDLRTLNAEYLMATIALLEGMAAVSCKLVVENIFKNNIDGILKRSCYTFEQAVNKNYFSSIFKSTN